MSNVFKNKPDQSMNLKTEEASRSSGFIAKVKKQKVLLLIMLPFILHTFIFKYIPMLGTIAAFQRYSFRGGIFGSPWVGFKYFNQLFSSPDVFQALRNTFVISIMGIIVNTFSAIVFAILITEMRNAIYKKLIQTISYLPNFISWVVIVGMSMTLFSIDDTGPVNNILLSLGIVKEPVYFLGSEEWYWPLVIGLGAWKSVGWNSIIYIAAIVSTDKQVFESAVIDGANKFKQIWYITLPSIKPTIVIMLIFSLGYILNQGMEPHLFLQNPLNVNHAEVLETYVAKYGLQQFNYSYGIAVGLVKSVAGLIMVLISNAISKRTVKMGIF